MFYSDIANMSDCWGPMQRRCEIIALNINGSWGVENNLCSLYHNTAGDSYCEPKNVHLVNL